MLAGPAKAFVLDLTADKSAVVKGELVKFRASIDIYSNENLPIEKIMFELTGPENTLCEFNPDGTNISECSGMTITKLSGDGSVLGYGYGDYKGHGYYFGYSYGYASYGYGYDSKLEYEITLNSAGYEAGEYTTKLTAFIEGEQFSEAGDNLIINNENLDIYTGGGGSCVADWKCTAWTNCINGKQTRVCKLENTYCNARTEKPLETMNCYLSPGSTNANNDGVSNNEAGNNGVASGNSLEETLANNTAANTRPNTLRGITGAVTGTIRDGGFWFITIIIGLLAALLIVLNLIRIKARQRKMGWEHLYRV